MFYPLKLIFPINKVRVYYCSTDQIRKTWLKQINEATTFRDVHTFYELKQDLGKGKFGVVKLAVCKETGEQVAIKIIKKRDVPLTELELQKREIEVLKLCQHPNIIRLIDTFETNENFFIVLEYLRGGDLFEYLGKRHFKITEDRARSMAHQIATALFYLHQYGIAHRDIKLENILMVDD